MKIEKKIKQNWEEKEVSSVDSFLLFVLSNEWR